MDSKVRVALIGYGHLGKWHAQKVEAFGNATLSFIVEPDKENAKSASEAHPSAKVVESLAGIMDKIDAGVISCPTTFHFSYLEELISHGKHILCEKPVCSTDDEAIKLKEMAQKNPQLIIQVGQSERLHAAWEILKEKEESLNFPGNLSIERLCPFHPRAKDVDVVSDLMIHDIDLMMYLFNERPYEVFATGYKSATDKWDDVVADFKFHSGRRAVIRSNRNFVLMRRALSFSNHLGNYYVDMATNELQLLINGSVEKIHYEKRDHLLLEHEYFYQSVLEGKRPLVSLNEGLLAFKGVSLTLKSLEKKQPVAMKWD